MPDGEPVLLDSLLPVLRKLEFLEARERVALAEVGPKSKDWEVAIALTRIGQHSSGEFISAMLEMAEKVLPSVPSDSVALSLKSSRNSWVCAIGSWSTCLGWSAQTRLRVTWAVHGE